MHSECRFCGKALVTWTRGRWEASQADKIKESLEMELQIRTCAGHIPFEASQDKFKGLHYSKILHIHWQALIWQVSGLWAWCFHPFHPNINSWDKYIAAGNQSWIKANQIWIEPWNQIISQGHNWLRNLRSFPSCHLPAIYGTLPPCSLQLAGPWAMWDCF